MYKNIKFSILFYAIAFLIFPIVAFAYDCKTTHPNLTDITVEIYNLQGSNKILQSEKYWIKKGSMDEDSGLRSINHFYDPVYNRTWKMGGIESIIPEVTSKVWVNDQARQSSYDVLFLASSRFIPKSFLEAKSNQAYNKAIYEYLKGNKKDAYYALGHVLHLLQDLTSVPHTRADTHMPPNDQSSYEIMSSYKTVNDFKVLFDRFKGISFAKRGDIYDYFYNVALYTNNNFYSEDTIMSLEYSRPEIFQHSAVDLTSGTDKYYLLGWDMENNNVYKLAKIIGREWKISNGLNKYDVNDPLVFEDYWARLSKKAVLEGTGLIDLFFKDVEKKKNDSSFFAMMESKHGVSFFVDLIGDIKTGINYLANLFNTHPEDVIIHSPNTTIINNLKEAATTTRKTTTTTTYLYNSIKTTSTTKKVTTTTTTKKTTTTTKKNTTTTTKKKSISSGGDALVSKCEFRLNETDISNENKKVIFNEIAWMGTNNSYNDEWIELKNISNEKIDISLWEIINNNKSIKVVIPSGTFLNPQEMYLLERTDDNSVLHVKSDLIYVGAIKNTDEELRLMNNNCVMVDIAKANSNWPAGSVADKRTMERNINFSWYTSSANCVNGVCGTPKYENSVFLEDFNKEENTTTTTTAGEAITTTTTTIITTTTTTTIAPSVETTTTTTIPEEIDKILFSEIQISGDTADNEFVELYNPLDVDINLTGWSIKQKSSNNSNLVSGDFLQNKIIPSKGYFLIVNKQEGKYTGEVEWDTTFNSESYSLVNDQVLVLYDQYDREVDKVGWGSGRVDGECEGNCLNNIENNQTFERKANESSDVESMTNGVDKLQGNGYDSNNNCLDFIIRNNADPQNSLSLKEPREESDELNQEFLLKNFEFYYLNNLKEKCFIEFDVDNYPFWNIDEEKEDGWMAMVFYLNSEENKQNSLTRDNNPNTVGYAGWQVSGNENPVLLLRYPVCGGGLSTKFGVTFDSSVVLPNIIGMTGGDFVCTEYDVGNYYYVPSSIAYNYNSNPNHFKIEVTGIIGPNYERNYNVNELFKEGDYITIGFYKGDKNGSSSFLDEARLVYEDNNKYNFNTNESLSINAPTNLEVNYDSENYLYNLSWNGLENEENLSYKVFMGNSLENIDDKIYDSDISLDGEFWKKTILLENLPYSSGKLFFAVKAWDSSHELYSDYSNIVEIDVYEMPKNINDYISNVSWKMKNGRMVVEFDLNMLGKYAPNGYLERYTQMLLTAWDFRDEVNINTCANPNLYISNGAISDYSCGNLNNNSRLKLFKYSTSMEKGHKEILIKYLSHPEFKELSIYNPDGLTMEDLNKLVKTEANPDGILEDLSKMKLVLNYGVRYETYCGYWVHKGDFITFTPNTNTAPNQTIYYFNSNEALE